MTDDALRQRVRQAGLDRGLAAVGIASAQPFAEARQALEQRKAAGLAGSMQFTYRNPARSCDPSRTLPGARSLVVGAFSYLREPPAEGLPPPPGPRGRVARYAWEDHYAALRTALGAVAGVLREAGHRAVVLADDNALVDRAAAARAGVGWYGNNTTILLPGRGSWYVLGAVLTDAALAPDEPLRPGCGACRACLPACPTGALTAPGVLDARRCLAWAVQAPGAIPPELRPAVGDRIYGCDDCQDACPVNVRATRRHPPPVASESARPTVDVLELLAAGDDEVLRRWGRWYIPGRQARYLRRTALVVLGNTADPNDARAVDALRAALRDPDPLLRSHAVWAAARLGLLAEAAACADDPDPGVRSEWAAAPSVPERATGRPPLVDAPNGAGPARLSVAAPTPRPGG
ncbi:MAG TPA: tRNA epoxyqueuosine(34) reductase QueG [Acidimicrobiales bacterium]|nr:tRNA epoxyqueuosine(34) reductase QueG [Acidimicrobiales bacterium]